MPSLWRFLTFTQNWGLDVATQNSFSHAWSLCIEEQFYLLIPFILYGLFRYNKQQLLVCLLFGLLISGIIFRLYNWNTNVQPFLDAGNTKIMTQKVIETIYYPTLGRIDGLIYGVGIATIFNFRPKLKAVLTKHGNLILVLGLVVLFVAFKICRHLFSYNNAILGFSLAPLGYALLVLAALSPSCVLYRVQSRITFFIASVSYSVYLIHKLVFHWVKLWFKDAQFNNYEVVIFTISIALSVLLGFVLYLLIEKPFMKLRRKILS